MLFKGVIFTRVIIHTYETKTILNKVYTNNNDSIIYTIQLDYYLTTLSACNSCTPSTNSTIITQTVTDLNQPATHTNSTSICHGTKDSIYIDYCGKTVWAKLPTYGTGCGPGNPRQESYMISGLGGPYYNFVYSYNPMLLTWMEYRLTYYSKISGSCGSLITSDYKEELMPNIDILVYPNPTKNSLTVKSRHAFVSYDIINYLGQVILTKNIANNNIDVSMLSAGYYMISLNTLGGKSYHQKIIKE